MAYADEEKLRILSGEGTLTEYQFHTHRAKHYFCTVCGIYPFHRMRRFPDKFGINVGGLEGVDVYALEPELVDGASFD